MNIDIVVDNSRGDTGKGKVVHHLLTKSKYDFVCRTNGSNNAGHTIYHNGVKFATHMIPAGVFWNIPSVICGGCLINVKSLFEEIEELERQGIKADSLLKIAYNAHIITDKHLDAEKQESKIGTTRRGVGPAAADKYARVGIRAESIPELKKYLVNTYDLFYAKSNSILIESAQGFYLDIDSEDYPFVTSSHCTSAGMLLGNFAPKDVRNVYGLSVAYRTYVGNASFQPKGEIFNKIAELGNERGVTTGRVRQVNYLNLNELVKANTINGCTHLIINKMDVLRQLDEWKIIIDEEVQFFTEKSFKQVIINTFPNVEVFFSYSPYEI